MRNRTTRYPSISPFARSLMSEWRHLKLPTTGETIVVAVSGGADSSALLLALDELHKAGKLSTTLLVAHFDHRIRPSSGKEAKWVSNLAKRLGYQVVVGKAKIDEIPEENLEQAARELRYAFLARTAKRKKASVVMTAHTMDDQAETVLLRLMRGSGDLGIGAMEKVRKLTKDSKIELVRPLLWARRADTVDYCGFHGVEYFVDEMNHDVRFARVKVRKQLIPLMQSFNNRVVEALSRTAGLLREDGAYLHANADELLQAAMRDKELDVKVLSKAPAALRRRALRQWIVGFKGNARRLESVHLEALDKLITGKAGGKTVELAGGIRVKRNGSLLQLSTASDSDRQ